MNVNDSQLGTPATPYSNTKANIEALTGLTGGECAYSTDTGLYGYYNAISEVWVWIEPSHGGLQYFFEDTASDIGGYKLMTYPPLGGATAYVSDVAPADGNIIEEWATASGVPGIVFIPHGIWSVHLHGYKTGGAPTREVRLHANIYKRVLAGTETLLGTTGLSIQLTNVEVDIPALNITIEDVILLTTDRLVIKIVEDIAGSGAMPTSVTIGYNGTTSARLEIPISDMSSLYAPISKGVTNGDSHDHSGGDGGQIAFGSLSGTSVVAILASSNIFTARQTINVNSTSALVVEQAGVKDNILVVDTTNGSVFLGGNVDSSAIYTTTGVLGTDRLYEINATVNSDGTITGRYPVSLFSQLTTSGATDFATASNASLTGVLGSVAHAVGLNSGISQGALGRVVVAHASATLDTAVGLRGQVMWNALGTVTNATAVDALLGGGSAAIKATSLYLFKGTISSSINAATTYFYGLYLPSISGASALNYAIYTNAGLNRLGDQLSVVGSADRIQSIIKANATQTTNLVEHQDSASGIHNIFNVTAGKENVLNETGINIDTRIEGDTDANLLFVDASADSIGIGTNVTTPAFVNIKAGTTAKAQFNFIDGTLKTSPVAGDMEYSGGHWFLTNGARHSIVTSAGVKQTTTTASNTVTETSIYSYTFAANELHADEKIIFAITGLITNASAADDYTIRFKLGGVTVHTVNRVGGNVTNQGWCCIYEGTVRTSGAGGTFVDYASLEEGALSYQYADAGTHAIDTTTTQLFEVTIQWANAKAGNVFSCTQGHLEFHH